jgi:hypothetical protein
LGYRVGAGKAMNPLGPNVRRLIAIKMAQDAIPSGGGFADGLKYLTSPGLGQKAQAAAEWAEDAIRTVKSAPDNPWGDDDEAIARELVNRVEAKMGRRQ